MTDYHHQGVEAALVALRMPGALHGYASGLLREAEAQNYSDAACLEALLAQELDRRRQHWTAHH